MAGLAYTLAALIAVVTWGLGGYDPWATLVLELGAFGLATWLVTRIVLTTSPEARERYLALSRSQKRRNADVEILTKDHAPAGGPFREPHYVAGYPFRRHGAGWLLFALTAWGAASLVPLPRALLSVLSPEAVAIRVEASALAGHELDYAPASVSPFLTLQDLLLWIAYLLIFLVAYHLADSSTAVRKLTGSLVLVGIGSGAFGLLQWLLILSSEAESALTGLNATGSFGNRNHYAYFQEMMLLVAIGWFLSRFGTAGRSADRAEAQDARARNAMIGIGVAAIALGLMFSLSRSGIAFGVVGCGALLLLTRHNEKRSRRASVATLATLAVLLALALWIGVDPIVSRFGRLPDEVSDGEGRAVVWVDSLGAVRDFWLTGSGLSSFPHVYPMYRSFGGRRFYSWAHNDYLQITVEMGVPGLLLTLALITWAVARARRVRRGLEADPRMLRLHAGYCAAALAVALHSFTDFGLHLPANAALFAVVIGVMTGMSPSRRRKRPVQRSV